MNSTLIAAVVFATLFPVAGLADLQITFRDGAPKDTFRISNTSACATGPVSLTLDMTPSMGKLIFDVTSAGAGVEVFQPLEVTKGAAFLNALPEVTDGQKTLALDISDLPPGEEIAFTIDVDDTIGAREITVNGSEMSGSIVALTLASENMEAVFDTSAVARLTTPACIS
jgi:hypothetical protein